jgi:(p)ppGpp synthase/HD superfamily hydrolase
MKNAGLAFEFAKRKHAGQLYGDEQYINHVLRVFHRVDGLNQGVVAMLHDTLEDTDTTFEELSDLFGSDIAYSVSILTRQSGQRYIDYIKSIKRSGDLVAIAVKIADLQENLSQPEKQTLKNRYRKALRILKEN